MSGWIKLHRKFLEWEWYDDTNSVRLFLHLLIKANHKDKNYRGMTIKRGQLVTGRAVLSAQTGLTEQQIRTVLTKLKSTGEITTRSTSRGTLVTIEKYSDYQDFGTESTSKATGKITKEQPTSNQQVTTNKNDKNDKKLDNIDYSVFGMSDYEVEEVKRIRKKNKGGAITQRVANGLAKEFRAAVSRGHTIDDLLTEWESRGWKSFKAEWVKGNEINNRANQPAKSLAERTAEQARIIHAECEAEEANQRAMDKDGSVVSTQMGFIGRRDAD